MKSGTTRLLQLFRPHPRRPVEARLSGPGVNVELLSSFRDGAYNVTETVDFEGTTYEFARLSAPDEQLAVAGIVALMLKPTRLSSDQSEASSRNCPEDNNTGTLPEEGDPGGQCCHRHRRHPSRPRPQCLELIHPSTVRFGLPNPCLDRIRIDTGGKGQSW